MENEYELPTRKEGQLSYFQGWLFAIVLIVICTLGQYAITTPDNYCDYKFCIKLGDK